MPDQRAIHGAEGRYRPRRAHARTHEQRARRIIPPGRRRQSRGAPSRRRQLRAVRPRGSSEHDGRSGSDGMRTGSTRTLHWHRGRRRAAGRPPARSLSRGLAPPDFTERRDHSHSKRRPPAGVCMRLEWVIQEASTSFDAEIGAIPVAAVSETAITRERSVVWMRLGGTTLSAGVQTRRVPPERPE